MNRQQMHTRCEYVAKKDIPIYQKRYGYVVEDGDFKLQETKVCHEDGPYPGCITEYITFVKMCKYYNN